MTFTISVYVPCYNAEKTIGVCLASLISQRRKLDEIIVVDDGSTDRTVEIAKRYPGVKFVRHEKNLGLAWARNSGVRCSKGELVGSIDSDCAADPFWASELVRLLEKDPTLCGVSGAVIESETGTIPDRWRAYHMAQHYGKKPRNNPHFLFGANTIFKREVLEKAGRYPPQYRTNGEDINICGQIYRRIPDAKLLYTPRAYVRHLRRDTYQSLANTYWRYQTYVSWTRPKRRTLRITLRQTATLLKMIWFHKFRWDLKLGRREGLIVAAYLTFALPWLQWKRHRQNNRDFPKQS